MDAAIRDAALRYAAAGWPIMPLAGAERYGSEWKCSCHWRDTCISPAKHPRTTQGLYDASTDPAVIEGWFRAFRTLNIGLRTGVQCDVLDVDAGGLDSLIAWTKFPAAGTPDEIALALWPGPVARTGKGYHFYLKPQHTSNRAGLLAGLDYRGDGGYVVAPPSLHVNGTRYEWLKKGRLTDAPEWLVALLYPATCSFVLRSGRVCGGTGTHKHREVEFVSSIELGLV